jgi:hypothetical protein
MDNNNNNNEDHEDDINENNHQITLEELNNISVNENNEIVFTLPIGENNSNIYNFFEIEKMLEDMQKNSNIFNENYDNNEFISFDIEFEFITPPNNIEENSNYFTSCKEIDQKVSKSEKIKKEDNLLNETCFICMDNYKVHELKRILPNCNHCFHKKCVDKWLKKRSSCPVCRDELIKEL